MCRTLVTQPILLLATFFWNLSLLRDALWAEIDQVLNVVSHQRHLSLDKNCCFGAKNVVVLTRASVLILLVCKIDIQGCSLALISRPLLTQTHCSVFYLHRTAGPRYCCLSVWLGGSGRIPARSGNRSKTRRKVHLYLFSSLPASSPSIATVGSRVNCQLLVAPWASVSATNPTWSSGIRSLHLLLSQTIPAKTTILSNSGFVCTFQYFKPVSLLSQLLGIVVM